MKKSIFYTIVFVISFFLQSKVHSQNNSGRVVYKVEVEIPEGMFKNLKDSNPEAFKRNMSFTKKVAELYDQMQYNLKFNNFSSTFSAQDVMSKDGGMLANLQASTGTYYVNMKKSEVLQQVEFQGNKFIVQRDPIKWEITGETKPFKNYQARKAIATQNLYNYRSKKKIIQKIEAWFVPDIPFSFGPEGFGGLPGLVVDLQVASKHYYVKKIRLGLKEEAIEKPNKGKRVSFQEYQSIMAGLGEKFKDFNGITD